MTDRDAAHRIELALMRGGTSRGVFVRSGVLSTQTSLRDTQVTRLMGSGSPGQVDGLGGGVPQTSKLVIIGDPTVAGADADYTFMQVGTDEPSVDMSGTCLNLSAAGMLFAYQSKMSADTSVVLHNTNTGELMSGTLLLDHGDDGYVEDAAISLDLSRLLPPSPEDLFPTGRPVDSVQLSDQREVRVSMLGIANPTVIVQAADLEIGADAEPTVLESSPDFVRAVEEVREWGRLRLVGAGHDALRQVTTRLPLVAVVAAPGPSQDVDLHVRLWAVGRIHRAIAGSAAIAVAVTACRPDSVLSGVLDRTGTGASLTIGHPSGATVIHLGYDEHGAVNALGLERTARRLMDGIAYV